MTESTEIKLIGTLAFEVLLDGHKIVIDAAKEVGGENRGPKPKNLMLASLAGCTGMDVASILRKMRVPFEGLKIQVSGDLTEIHPKHFESMHIKYIIKGKGLSREKIDTAIQLSQDKYCGVSYSYRETMKLTHEVIIEE